MGSGLWAVVARQESRRSAVMAELFKVGGINYELGIIKSGAGVGCRSKEGQATGKQRLSFPATAVPVARPLPTTRHP
mgnify:CR=1 FL=1